MKKIVIASVLKPANDVRSWDRIGHTLWQNSDYSIYLVGNGLSRNIQGYHRLHFETFNHKVTGIISRFRVQREFYHILEKLHPDLIIITTPELLPLSFLYKFFHSNKIVYDLQEDYEKNIKYQKIHSGMKKLLGSCFIRITHRLARRYVDHFLLAEQCYIHLPFVQKGYTVAENKFAQTRANVPSPDLSSKKIKLAFTGVLSEYSGYKKAIAIYRKLVEVLPATELHIAGYTYFPGIVDDLKKLENKENNVHLHGIDEYLDHQQLIDVACSCNLAVIAHQHNEVSKDRIPTKLYEYLYLGIPFVVDKNTNWFKKFSTTNLCIGIEIDNPDPSLIINMVQKYRQDTDYRRKDLSSWASEGQKILQSTKTLL